MTAAQTIYTPQDLLSDRSLRGYELVGGQLVERPTAERSCAIGGKIVRLLGNEAYKTGEAIVYPADLGYQCFADEPTKVRFPDVSVIRSERRAQIGANPGHISIAPDLAVEVLSPNDVNDAMEEKIDDYLRAGFPLIWVVNPRRRTVNIYRPDGDIHLLTDRDEITCEPALASFRCKVAEFFNI